MVITNLFWRSPCKLLSMPTLLPCRMQAWLLACAT
jgi:hypothetical protein